MAAKFSSVCEVPLRPRKGHDMAWSCDEHGEPIKLYCEEHNVPLCNPCATKDHQKPCNLANIGNVILKMESELGDKLLELEEMLQRSKTLNAEIESCSPSMSKHLKTVNDEVDTAFKHKIKSVQDKEREEILLINEEADDKIRIISDQIQIINESRERRIKSIREKSKTNQQSLVDTQVQLTADIKDIDTTVGEKIEELKGKNQHNINTMDNIGSKIRRIRQDDKALVNEARRVISLLDARENENLHQDILNALDCLKLEVQRVKFVEGKVGGDNYARIHGYIGKWEILKSIDISPIVQIPCILGFISNNEVLVSDLKNNELYITNISSGQTRRFFTGDNNNNIISCAIVDTNLIVCGKWRRFTTGDSLNGCIALYDRQWKHVRNIAIPKNKSKFGIFPISPFDVDKDGMVLAAELDQPYIYVINPADGKIVNSITIQGKMVRGGIQALSSGDVLVKTEKDEFTVISRSGEQKSVIHHDLHDRGRAYCRVDKLTNTLYIKDWDKKKGINTIDQVSCDHGDDDYKTRRIVEYEHTDRSRAVNLCAISPSGNIIASKGASLLVYKNKFAV